MAWCECHHLPPSGVFAVGGRYEWCRIIDAVVVIDENKSKIIFDEIKWLWYFGKVNAY